MGSRMNLKECHRVVLIRGVNYLIREIIKSSLSVDFGGGISII